MHTSQSPLGKLNTLPKELRSWQRSVSELRLQSALHQTLVFLLTVSFFAPAPAAAQTNFYPKGNPIRDNGLDMNDDGVVGEPGVDDLVCDGLGGSVVSNRYMEDVDDDGVLEEQVFVDAQNGVDNGSCGRPNSPCRTLAYAFNNRVDGHTDGNEDIVCFTGDDSTPFDISVSGLPTTKTRPRNTASSNEQRSFFYPKDPAMLVGWDTDDDGIYPPNDPDDLSRVSQTSGRQFLVSGNHSNFEVAHLEAFESGSTSANNGGFFEQSPGGEELAYWYFHDIHVDRNNYGKCHRTGNILWSMFRFHPLFVAAEHFQVTDTYGYIWRGAIRGHDVRFANWNITQRALGGNNSTRDHLGNRCVDLGATSGGSIMRLWATTTLRHNIEWIDNRLEVVGYDQGIPGTGIDQGVTLTCLRDLAFAGNFVKNYPGLPLMDMNDGICTAQLIEDRYWNNNTLIFDDPNLVDTGRFYPAVGWLGTDGPQLASDGIVGDIQFNNNFVDYSAVPLGGGYIDGFLLMENSPTANLSGADLEVVGNTLIMDCNRPSFGCFIEQHGANNFPGSVRIRDNWMYNPDPTPNDSNIFMIDTQAMIGNLTPDSNFNTYYNCNFKEAGTEFTSMASWRNNVGEGSGSVCGVNISPLSIFKDGFESGSVGIWTGSTP